MGSNIDNPGFVRMASEEFTFVEFVIWYVNEKRLQNNRTHNLEILSDEERLWVIEARNIWTRERRGNRDLQRQDRERLRLQEEQRRQAGPRAWQGQDIEFLRLNGGLPILDDISDGESSDGNGTETDDEHDRIDRMRSCLRCGKFIK